MGYTFDVIIFSDVFEHLVNSAKVFSDAMNFLKPGGRVIVSLPNVDHWTIRVQLLCRKWKYLEQSILDKTHVYFYTIKDAKRLFSEGNLRIMNLAVPHDLQGWKRIKKLLCCLVPSTIHAGGSVFNLAPEQSIHNKVNRFATPSNEAME